MSKLLIIDWGSQPVLLMEADQRGGRVLVRNVIELSSAEEASGSIDSALAHKLRDYAGSGARVIGLVGRSQAVLRNLRLPHAPPEEIPGIVRFQAIRELSFPVEQAAIDYEVFGAPDGNGERSAILAALQQEVIERYQGAVRGAGLELARLGLRPYASYRAYTEKGAKPEGAVLVVSLAGESVELTVAEGNSVLFTRAALLRGMTHEPGSEPNVAAMLVGEVRRTLAAFANQLPGTELSHIAFAAGPDEHQAVLSALSAGLSIPVERFDPLQAVPLSGDMGAHSTSSSLLVASIGAALSADEAWPIDFLTPKKPVVPRDRRKPMALAAAAALLAIVASGYWVAHQRVARAEREIELLVTNQKKLQEALKTAEDVMRKFQAVEEWTKAEANCLEELRQLSELYPDTREMYTTSVKFTGDGSASGLGSIVLEGVARRGTAIGGFHTKLNAGENYGVRPLGQVQENPRTGEYRYSFTSSLVRKPPQPEAPATRSAPAEKPAKESAPKSGSIPQARAASVIPNGTKGN